MIKFEYTKRQYDYLCEECMLSEDERLILKLRCMNKSNTQLLTILEDRGMPMSLATLGRKIKIIDNKIHKALKESK